MRSISLAARRLAVATPLLFLGGCGGGGCGNCSVPAFRAPGPGASPPVLTPVGGPTTPPTPMPGATPTPQATPLAPATPAPQFSTCVQGGPAAIVLGSALAPFAILAGSTVTNVGNTNVANAATAITPPAIADDRIGVWPGTSITGFPPGIDKDGPSAIYGVGLPFNQDRATPANAQSALTAAYNAVAGRASTATFPGGQDLASASVPGHPVGTLPPGTYASASTFSIATGNLTLDGGNDPTSVFVFQAGTGLTTTANGNVSGNVLLIGGASACNVFWQVGTSAVLGGATFYGNVLANQSVTINATNFTGRALAENAAVTIPVAGGSIVVNPGGN